MRRVDALLDFFPRGQFYLVHCAWQPLQIPHEHTVHAALAHSAGGEGSRMGREARAEEGTALKASGLGVFADRLRCAEVNTFGLVTVALQVKPQRRFVAVLV